MFEYGPSLLGGVPRRHGGPGEQQVPHDDVLGRPRLIPTAATGVERVGRRGGALDGHEERRQQVRVLRPRVHVHVDRELSGTHSSWIWSFLYSLF